MDTERASNQPPATSWWTANVATQLWGRDSIDGLFHAPLRVVPWRSAPQRRGHPVVSAVDRSRLLAGPPAIADLDPRSMLATQTFVVQTHVTHYLTDAWETTGRTSADQDQAHNRWPLVWIDEQGRQILLGGHHRSMAALIEGRPVRCRVLHGEVDQARPVLPRLLVGTSCPFAHQAMTDATTAATAIAAGTTVLVPDLATAEATLTSLDLDEAVIADRLAMATTGRCHIAR